MEIQSGPCPLVLPTGDIPMSAFFRSVSASFSTTFCFWAAISSLVFSASLQGEKHYHREMKLGSSSANQGMRGQGDKKPTSCQHQVLTAMRTTSVFSCMSTCVASRSKEGIISPSPFGTGEATSGCYIQFEALRTRSESSAGLLQMWGGGQGI